MLLQDFNFLVNRNRARVNLCSICILTLSFILVSAEEMLPVQSCCRNFAYLFIKDLEINTFIWWLPGQLKFNQVIFVYGHFPSLLAGACVSGLQPEFDMDRKCPKWQILLGSVEDEFHSSFSHSEYVLASVSPFCKSQLPVGHTSEEEQYNRRY